MHYIKAFFSYDFLFYINRVRLDKADKLFLALACLSVLVGIALWLWARFDTQDVRKALILRYWRLSITFGLLGLLWFGFRYEYVAWFGTHFAFILLMLVIGVWKAYLLRYVLTQYKVDKVAWEHRQQKEKYLRMAH